jgi:hypothetical protein
MWCNDSFIYTIPYIREKINMSGKNFTVVEVRNEIFDKVDKLSRKYDLKKRRLVSDLLLLGLKEYNPEVVYSLGK